MLRIISVFLFSLLFYVTSLGQNIVWQMRPTDYNNITRVAKDLYLAERNGKVGLIRSDGMVVAPIENSSLTPFVSGLALLMRNENDKERVVGTLSRDGYYTPFQDVYYALKGQAFFSEKLLTVSNSRGYLGYVNASGEEVIGFNGKYARIKPFTEGFAAVFDKSKNYSLINKNGAEIPMITGFEVGSGMNVYRGEAIIWNAYGDAFYAFNPLTGKTRKVKKPNSNQTDYLYCFAEITGRTKQMPTEEPVAGVIGLKPVKEGNYYGYSNADRVLLPPQFDDATAFEDNIAVVHSGNKIGMVRLGEDGCFSLFAEQSHHVYSVGATLQCKFALNVPTAYSGSNITLRLRDEHGIDVPVIANGVNYEFSVCPNTNECTYNASIYCDDMHVWDGDITYTFKKRVVAYLNIACSDNGPRADENDNLTVTIRITNPTDEDLRTPVTIDCDCECFHKKQETITVEAGRTRVITTTFSGIKKRYFKQLVKVTTAYGKSTYEVANVWPYYD